MPKQVTEEDLASGVRGLGGLATLQPARRDSPFRDSRAEVKTIEVPAAAESAPPVSKQLPKEPSEQKPRAAERPEVVETTRQKIGRGEKRKAAQRKADLFTEPVTLRMSPQMRDEVETMARELQRAKTSKSERITANTVMRVAVRLMLEHFSPCSVDAPNSEEELYQVVRRTLKLS